MNPSGAQLLGLYCRENTASPTARTGLAFSPHRILRGKLTFDLKGGNAKAQLEF